MAIGEVRNNPPGTTYRSYREMIDAGIHRQNIVGMVGNPRDGTESVVLNGGYPGDSDFGDQIVYTGFGGQDPQTKRQVRDQEWVGANEGMRTNMAMALPVRVIRGSALKTPFAPESGYRYDGLYSVLDADHVPSVDGPLICRFILVKTDSARVPSTGIPPEPPSRVESTVMRILRDTAMANRIKKLYEYTCQVCGKPLSLPGGAYYAEGAHIRPLGEPHHGLDVESNILCLCPNHHLLFDRGAIYVTKDMVVMDGMTGDVVGMLTVRHDVDRAQLAHHRGRFGR